MAGVNKVIFTMLNTFARRTGKVNMTLQKATIQHQNLQMIKSTRMTRGARPAEVVTGAGSR